VFEPLQDCLVDRAIGGLKGYTGVSMAPKPCRKGGLIFLMLVMDEHVADLIVREARERDVCRTLQDLSL
jgi:hypothetical protein